MRCYVQDIEGGKPRADHSRGNDRRLRFSRRPAGPGSGERRRARSSIPSDGGPARAVPGATPDDAVVRWTADGKSLIVVSLWSDVPVRDREGSTSRPAAASSYKTLGPADLTGAVQIAPIAFSDDGKSYA